MIALIFLYFTAVLFTPIAIYLAVLFFKHFNFIDDSLNGLKFYQRDVVGVYTDKHGNKIMINRND